MLPEEREPLGRGSARSFRVQPTLLAGLDLAVRLSQTLFGGFDSGALALRAVSNRSEGRAEPQLWRIIAQARWIRERSAHVGGSVSSETSWQKALS